jgi:hypothetical protein
MLRITVPFAARFVFVEEGLVEARVNHASFDPKEELVSRDFTDVSGSVGCCGVRRWPTIG